MNEHTYVRMYSDTYLRKFTLCMNDTFGNIKLAGLCTYVIQYKIV